MVKAKDATITVQDQFFYTSPSSGGRREDPTQPLETAVIGDGWRGGERGGLSAVPPSPNLIGRTRGEGDATMHAAPVPARALELPRRSSFCLFPLLISLLITAKLDGCL